MKTIAIGSGKGGVGKTTATANLAVLAAQRGKRTIALDADFGLANLNLHLGLSGDHTIADVMNGRCGAVEALRLHDSGLRVLAGANGEPELADISPAQARSVVQQLSKLEKETELLFVDAAAGVHAANVATLGSADLAVLILTPDPSSFVDAYATVKQLVTSGAAARIGVVVNHGDEDRTARLLFARFQTIVGEKLSCPMTYYGFIGRDQLIAQSVFARQPIVVGQPKSRGALQYAEVFDRISGVPVALRPEGGFFGRMLDWFGQRARAA